MVGQQQLGRADMLACEQASSLCLRVALFMIAYSPCTWRRWQLVAAAGTCALFML